MRTDEREAVFGTTVLYGQHPCEEDYMNRRGLLQLGLTRGWNAYIRRGADGLFP